MRLEDMPTLEGEIERLRTENARLREAGRTLVEANTKHFNTATENYEEAVKLREELSVEKEHVQQCVRNIAKLNEELAAAQATIEQMRESLESIATGESDNGCIASTGELVNRAQEALALPTNQDALHEARAVAVERLKDTPFFSADQKEYLAGVAAAHRARKKGK